MNDDANIRTGVLDEVRAEREAQDAQLGGPEHADIARAARWLAESYEAGEGEAR